MDETNIFKSKVTWIMAAIAVIAVIIIIAVVAMNGNDDNPTETPSGDIVGLDQTTTDRNNKTTDNTTDRRTEDESTSKKNGLEDEITSVADDIGEGLEDISSGINDVVDDVLGDEETTKNLEASITPVTQYFSKTEELQWPVMGNIILDYSMDSTVYFPTLDVYKCNDGIMIQSEVGTDVVAAAAGVVKKVGTNEEIGGYVVVDLKDGYEATYGQLANIKVKVGETVQKGQKIGTVAEPTKYYSIEGCNVYFKLEKDGKPIDPVEYFVY